MTGRTMARIMYPLKNAVPAQRQIPRSMMDGRYPRPVMVVYFSPVPRTLR